MMEDIQVLVRAQREQINQVRVYTESARDDIKKGEELVAILPKKIGRGIKKKCIIIVVALLVIAAILLVLYKFLKW